MRKGLFLVAIGILIYVSAFSASPTAAVQRMGSKATCFTENKGQWPEEVKFRTDAGGAIVWICKDRIVYQFLRTLEHPSAESRSRERGNPGSLQFDPMEKFNHEPDSIEQLVITARFVGSNQDVQVVGEGLVEYKCNYFLGNDPSKWRTDVENYEVVTLNGMYAGVDLRLFAGENGRLSYEYAFAPDVDEDQIRVEYEGLEQTSVDNVGRITAQTKWGEIVGLLAMPTSATELIGFSVEAQTDTEMNSQASRSPHAVELVYSTYLGGTNGDYGNCIAVDAAGSAYVTGNTGSSNFPTEDAYDETYNGWDLYRYDVFITKFSVSGESLIYSSYLGGMESEIGNGIAVDGDGNAYVTGYTSSTDFPTQSAFDANHNGGASDAFVAKLSSSGNALFYCTYLGGSGNDEGNGIAVDDGYNAYVIGNCTWQSTDFPTHNAFDTSLDGNDDVFVTKLSSSGSSVIYSTYLGGSEGDGGNGITVDAAGSAYVTGTTYSSDFPTLNAYDGSLNGGSDVFVIKFSAAGNALVYSTYLGGSSGDIGYGIAVDASGSAYVTGGTASSDFPTVNAYDGIYNGRYDVFVSKLSPSGDGLTYSTFEGYYYQCIGNSVAVDGSGYTYVTGLRSDGDYPTAKCHAFVSKFSNSGSFRIYSEDFGSWGHFHDAKSIVVDNSGNAYVTGQSSGGFPSQNAFDATYNGGDYDAFVTKLSAFPAASGLLDNENLLSITIHERTSPFTHAHLYPRNDPALMTDLSQNPPAFENDFKGTPTEYYDVFVSDADGVLDAHGEFLTIECYFNQTTGGVGNNIDAIELDFASGPNKWAYWVSSFILGEGVDPQSQGAVSRVLGPLDGTWSGMGYHYSRMTVGFSAEDCLPTPVSLISPINGVTLTASPTMLQWLPAACGDGYRLEYSSDETFPPNSGTTVSLSLPFESGHLLVLPSVDSPIYWRVYSLLGSLESSPSVTGYFYFDSSLPNEVVSVRIIEPSSNAQLEYGSLVNLRARLVSNWTGPIAGRWLVDGSQSAAIALDVGAGTPILLDGPELPTLDVGLHTAQVEIMTPNQMSSSLCQFVVSEPEYGLSDHLIINVAPSKLPSDGQSVSTITMTMVDSQGRRVWDDNGWTQDVTLLLTGPGSLPSSAHFTHGQAVATYTAGSTPGTAQINAVAFLQEGLYSEFAYVGLLDEVVDVFLERHDYANAYLSNLKLDMFVPALSIWPSFDLSTANLWVENTIRNQTPSEAEIESFERLVIAEELLVKAFRFDPDQPNPYSGTQFIGGDQELFHAGVKNSLASVSGGISVGAIMYSVAAKLGQSTVEKLLRKVLIDFGDQVFDWALGEIDDILILLPDKRLANTLSDLGITIKKVVQAYVEESGSPLIDLISTPIVTAPASAELLSKYPGELQDDLYLAAERSTNGDAMGSIDVARSAVNGRLLEIHRISASTLSNVTIIEQEYEFDATEIYQSLQTLSDGIDVSDLPLIRDALMNTLSKLAGTHKLVFAAGAASKSFSAYGAIRSAAEKGCNAAYGYASDQLNRLENDSFRPGSSTGEISRQLERTESTFEKLQLSLRSYSDVAGRIRDQIVAGDTSNITTLSDSMTLLVDSYQEFQNEINAIVHSSLDSALGTVPSIDSLLEEYISLSNEAFWRQMQAMISVAFFIQDPFDASFWSVGGTAIDGSITASQQATYMAYALRQITFLTPSAAAFKIQILESSPELSVGDSIVVSVWVTNIGGSNALENWISVRAEAGLQPVTPDSIVFTDLNPGDSTLLIVHLSSHGPAFPDSIRSLAVSVSISANSSSASTRTRSKTFLLSELVRCGDADGNSIVTISDAVYLINYIFAGGPAPIPSVAGDVDCNGIVTISDAVYLINYIFAGGVAPCAACP